MSNYLLVLADDRSAYQLVSVTQTEQEAVWNTLTSGASPQRYIMMVSARLLRFTHEHKKVTVYRFDSDESCVKLNETLTHSPTVIDEIVAVGTIMYKFGYDK